MPPPTDLPSTAFPAISPTADRTIPTATSEPVDVPITPTAALATPVPGLATPGPLAALAIDPGEVVLELPQGTDSGQVGILDSGEGPTSFRIGADGTIRILDAVNRRLLFFTPNGTQQRSLALNEFDILTDFIVNGQGEAFVYGMNRNGPTIIRYSQGGDVLEQLPVSPGLFANAISFNGEGDLLLTRDNTEFWVIRRRDTFVPTIIQPLTRQQGAVTPRSPVVFRTIREESANGTPQVTLQIESFSGGVNSDSFALVGAYAMNVPESWHFLNVDRAMDLYFISDFDTQPTSTIDIWRVSAQGEPIGGVRIASECAIDWRRIYVDQAGSAWTFCQSSSGVTVKRYGLRDPQGQPLPAAAATPPDDSPWRPGRRFSAA
jgi:hypothetical protein